MKVPNITKVSKTYNNLFLDRITTILRIDDYDAIEIKEIFEEAHAIAENYIQKDIAYTLNEYTFTNYSGQYIVIDEGNFDSISGITSTDANNNVTNITGYTVTHKDSNQFTIKLNNSFDNKELKISFYTGYASDNLPKPIRRAIKIIINDLYDWERASYSVQSSKKSDVIERYLNYYRKDYFHNYNGYNYNYQDYYYN